MTFEEALVVVRDGEEITRPSWGGDYMMIASWNFNPIYVRVSAFSQTPWVANKEDVLAGDWVFV